VQRYFSLAASFAPLANPVSHTPFNPALLAPDVCTLLLPVSSLLQLSKAERHRDLISISVVHTLNAALCEFHLQNCPPSQQLRDVCDKAQALYLATKIAVRKMDVELSCVDRVVSKHIAN
jgi:hypothetical protein